MRKERLRQMSEWGCVDEREREREMQWRGRPEQRKLCRGKKIFWRILHVTKSGWKESVVQYKNEERQPCSLDGFRIPSVIERAMRRKVFFSLLELKLQDRKIWLRAYWHHFLSFAVCVSAPCAKWKIVLAMISKEVHPSTFFFMHTGRNVSVCACVCMRWRKILLLIHSRAI